MNLFPNLDTSFFNPTTLTRIFLLVVLIGYLIFALLVVKQVHILTKTIQTDDGLILNTTAWFLLLLGGFLLAITGWLVFM